MIAPTNNSLLRRGSLLNVPSKFDARSASVCFDKAAIAPDDSFFEKRLFILWKEVEKNPPIELATEGSFFTNLVAVLAGAAVGS